jgi:hypothetical protein
LILFCLTLLVSLSLLSPTALAQESRCADCHFANPAAPGAGHIADWDHSAHARNNVGCEKCHGGDATTFESFRAHQGILNARNPASPVHRTNLPGTCGNCHLGPLAEFQKSKHYELVRSGSEEGPTCSSCHGEVGARLLSPKGLAAQCERCHGGGKRAPRPDYPPQGKLMQEGIREVRDLLKEANALIRRVKDKTRRGDLERAYRQAEVPLIEATQAGHAFVFDQLEERLRVARQRAESLLELLANPAGL